MVFWRVFLNHKEHEVFTQSTLRNTSKGIKFCSPEFQLWEKIIKKWFFGVCFCFGKNHDKINLIYLNFIA